MADEYIEPLRGRVASGDPDGYRLTEQELIGLRLLLAVWDKRVEDGPERYENTTFRYAYEPEGYDHRTREGAEKRMTFYNVDKARRHARIHGGSITRWEWNGSCWSHGSSSPFGNGGVEYYTDPISGRF